MSYYYFNRQEILQKAKEKYSKEKAAEYLFTKQRSDKRKVKIKEYQEKYQELVQYKKEALENK